MAEEIILKKENGGTLSYEELSFFFGGYLHDQMTDEEMTRLLKAICKCDMNDQEIFDLTDIFLKSGDQLDLSSFSFTVDKHSTGGVGDKTTLLLLPFLAALGFTVVKMSGRGLGYTGGTIDKLESIPGFVTNLSEAEVFNQAKDLSLVLTSQTKNLCPMDKKVYALRDVTGTTNSIGLIASSIMSKKIASGAQTILIDLKVGKGALVESKKDALRLAHLMKEIGKRYHRDVFIFLTRMDEPLGNAVGNLLEVLEVEDLLSLKVENEVLALVKEMSVFLLEKKFGWKRKKAEALFRETLVSGRAFEVYKNWVKAQHGTMERPVLQGKKLYAKESGFVQTIDARTIGVCAMDLGAGRKNKGDSIDFEAGIVLSKKRGDYVHKGEVLLTFYGKNEIDEERLYQAFAFSKLPVHCKKRIIQVIS